MVKKLALGPILAPLAHIWTPNFFLWILPLLDVIHYCKLSLYAISRKTNEPNLRKWQKTQFQAQLWPIWPTFGPPKLFFKNLASSVTRYHGQQSSCKISEKTKDPFLRSPDISSYMNRNNYTYFHVYIQIFLATLKVQKQL